MQRLDRPRQVLELLRLRRDHLVGLDDLDSNLAHGSLKTVDSVPDDVQDALALVNTAKLLEEFIVV